MCLKSGLSAITDYGRLPDLEAVFDLDMVITIMFGYPLPVFYALGKSSDLPATQFFVAVRSLRTLHLQ